MPIKAGSVKIVEMFWLNIAAGGKRKETKNIDKLTVEKWDWLSKDKIGEDK